MRFRRRRDRSVEEFQNIQSIFMLHGNPRFVQQLAKAREEMPELYSTYNLLYSLMVQMLEHNFDDTQE